MPGFRTKELEAAVADWEAEVEIEAASLIENRGVPPEEAIVRARQAVTERRRKASWDHIRESFRQGTAAQHHSHE